MAHAAGTSGLADGRTPVEPAWEYLTLGTSGQGYGLF